MLLYDSGKVYLLNVVSHVTCTYLAGFSQQCCADFSHFDFQEVNKFGKVAKVGTSTNCWYGLGNGVLNVPAERSSP